MVVMLVSSVWITWKIYGWCGGVGFLWCGSPGKYIQNYVSFVDKFVKFGNRGCDWLMKLLRFESICAPYLLHRSCYSQSNDQGLNPYMHPPYFSGEKFWCRSENLCFTLVKILKSSDFDLSYHPLINIFSTIQSSDFLNFFFFKSHPSNKFRNSNILFFLNSTLLQIHTRGDQ